MNSALRRRRLLAAALLAYSAAAPALVAAVMLANRPDLRAAGLTFGQALLWQSLVYFSWALLAPLIYVSTKRFRLRSGGWLAPLPAYVIAGIVAVSLHSSFSAWLDWFMNPLMPAPFSAAFGRLFLDRLPVDLLIYTAMLGVFYAMEYYQRLGMQEKASLRLEAELSRSQLQSLKMQLQPHFLFNALQAIAVLIRHEPEKAVRMTVLLGDMLRTTLSRATSQLVPLRDELALLEQYLAIEQVRFGDELVITFDVDPAALDCMVPDLVLQPLVENAIKHGLASMTGVRRLDVRAYVTDALHLEVRDSGVGIRDKVSRNGNGVGLSNTRARLEALYGSNFVLDVRSASGTGTTAEIVIPI